MNLNKKIKIILTCFCLLFAVNAKSQVDSDLITNALYNSSVISQNLPASLNTGQVYPVSITIRNIGLNTWNTNENYKLSLFSQVDNKYQSDVWEISQVSIPYNVSPLEKVTFLFNVRAPKSTGTFNCRWSMSHNNEYFGEKTFNMIDVNEVENLPVNYSDVSNNSEFLNQSVPSNMNTGQEYKVWITMKNTGKTAWSSSTDNIYGEYKLGFINDMQSKNINSNFNFSPVSLSSSVEPGESANIEFSITAPLQTGSYYFQTMMMQNNSYFGQKSNYVWINVEGTNNGDLNNAFFVRQEISDQMEIGKDYKISVKMSNTGKSVWTKDRFALAIVDSKMLPLSFNQWSLGFVEVPEAVQPGASVTFEFNVTAPYTPDYYPLQFSLSENGRPFGDSTPPINILVSKARK